MILGVSLSTFVTVHVIISLVGIGSGSVVVFGLLTAKRLDGWTAVFLTSTLLTSLTGFGFPFAHLLPSHVVGLISIGDIVKWRVQEYENEQEALRQYIKTA